MCQFTIIDDKAAFRKDHQLGSPMPPFSLTFYDDGGNESCAFNPPESGDVMDEASPDDSFNFDDGIEGKSESKPSYWVKLSCRDENINVDVTVEEDSFSPNYPISEVRLLCLFLFVHRCLASHL